MVATLRDLAGAALHSQTLHPETQKLVAP